LIAHVVNGENGPHVTESGIFGVGGAEKDGDERGLPIVAMEDMRNAKNFCGFKDCPGK
jgi:hypothetical protein